LDTPRSAFYRAQVTQTQAHVRPPRPRLELQLGAARRICMCELAGRVRPWLLRRAPRSWISTVSTWR